jgi:hypothetical protein
MFMVMASIITYYKQSVETLRKSEEIGIDT